MLMTATPTSIAALETALLGALPDKYKPCVPAPTRDGKIHISIAYVPPAGVPGTGQPTKTLSGDNPATVLGPAVIPGFVICPECWEAFIALVA